MIQSPVTPTTPCTKAVRKTWRPVSGLFSFGGLLTRHASSAARRGDRQTVRARGGTAGVITVRKTQLTSRAGPGRAVPGPRSRALVQAGAIQTHPFSCSAAIAAR